jgi:polyhydroxyalkanoate synthase
LKRHSSGTVSAPVQAGNANYNVIEAAPGRYVKQKSN